MLTLGCLADQGDVAQEPVRFYDTQSHDLSAAAAIVRSFVHNADCLFVQKRPWEVPGTYSHMMLQRLSSRRILLKKSSGAVCMGGVPLSETVCARVAARSATWARMAMEQLRTEYPTGDVVLAFGCMSLRKEASLHNCENQLHTLAKLFGIDATNLVKQFHDHRRFATTAYEHLGLADTLQAWRESYRRTNSRAASRRAHPSDALRLLLVRLGVFRQLLRVSVQLCNENNHNK